jgi:rare lipoprotein A
MKLYSKIFCILFILSLSACSSGIRYSSNIYSDNNLRSTSNIAKNNYSPKIDNNSNNYSKSVASTSNNKKNSSKLSSSKNNTTLPKPVYDETYIADNSKNYNDNNSDLVLSGLASFYSDEFNGRITASGEVYDMFDLTAAHRTLPFGTLVQIKNFKNGKKVVVRINDRGPLVDDRIIDLSLGAATKLGMIDDGVVNVQITIISYPD